MLPSLDQKLQVDGSGVPGRWSPVSQYHRGRLIMMTTVTLSEQHPLAAERWQGHYRGQKASYKTQISFRDYRMQSSLSHQG